MPVDAKSQTRSAIRRLIRMQPCDSRSLVPSRWSGWIWASVDRYCGIGFHQIPQYRSTLAQIHPDHLLGTDERESHGCIRVSRRMADRIWDFASTGTKVVVTAQPGT